MYVLIGFEDYPFISRLKKIHFQLITCKSRTSINRKLSHSVQLYKYFFVTNTDIFLLGLSVFEF